MYLLFPFALLIISFISFHVTMVCAGIMGLIKLVTGKFMQSALYFSLFMFLMNILVQQDPRTWDAIKGLLMLGAILEVGKFLVKQSRKKPEPVLPEAEAPAQVSHPRGAQDEATTHTLTQNRHGTWVLK